MPVRSLRDGTIKVRVDDDGGGSAAEITVSLEEGDLSFTERRAVNVVRDRGVLDHARKAEDDALELSFSAMLQRLKDPDTSTPTLYEALRNIGDASAWVSQETDGDEYAVEIEFTIADPAGGSSEVLTFDRFHPQEVSLQEGDPSDVIAVSGAAPIRSPMPTPQDVPGLVSLFSADKITGLTDGQAVTSWADLVHDNDLAQATGSKQPVYKTSIVNSLPVVRFDGTDDALKATLAALAEQPNTIFLIAAHRSGTVTADEYMFGGGDASNDSHTVEAVEAATDAYGYNAGTQQTQGTLDTAFRIFVVAFDGAASVARLDRSSSTLSLGTRALKELVLGADRTEGAGFADVDVAELAVYDRKLSTSQMRMLEDYASWKYGL